MVGSDGKVATDDCPADCCAPPLTCGCRFNTLAVAIGISAIGGSCGSDSLVLSSTMPARSYEWDVDFSNPYDELFLFWAGTATGTTTNCDSIRDAHLCPLPDEECDCPNPSPDRCYCDSDPPPECVDCSQIEPGVQGNVQLMCDPDAHPNQAGIIVSIQITERCMCDCGFLVNGGGVPVWIDCADLVGTHIISVFGGTVTATVTIT